MFERASSPLGETQGFGEDATNWRTRLAGYAFVMLIVGPYLIGGLRTEQLLVYLAALIGFSIRRGLPLKWRGYDVVFLLWVAFSLWVVVAGLLNPGTLDPRRWIAGLDDLLLPIALLLVLSVWFAPTRAFFRSVLVGIVGMAMASSLVALAEAHFGPPMVRLVLSAQVGPGNIDSSVGWLASQNGRFSGFFNQPAEAGVAYGLALVVLLYLNSSKRMPRGSFAAVWSLLMIGGLLSLSKVFLAALLVALIVQVRSWRLAMVVVGATVVGGALVVLGAVSGFIGFWGGAPLIGTYALWLQNGASLIYVVSAGRYGTGPNGAPPPSGGPAVPVTPSNGTVIEDALNVAPRDLLLGFGPAGADMPYDSAWFAALLLGGAVGLILMLALHVTLVYRVVRARAKLRLDEWRLAAAVIALAAVGSLGLPVLTANRAGSLMWTVMAVLLFQRSREPASPRTVPSE